MSGRACAAWLAENGASLDAAQLWRWEKGERFPRPATVAKVAKLTGIAVDDLVPEDGHAISLPVASVPKRVWGKGYVHDDE